MKFRGKLTDSLCMKQFSNIISTLAKLSKVCVLRITSEKLFFVIPDDGIVFRGPMMWCIVDQKHFFSYFKMEGVSPKDNEIFIQLKPDMVAKSLSSLKGGQSQASDPVRSVKIKLTNKLSPCLTFEIELPSLGHARLCVHDIPVDVVPLREWFNYEEPRLPTFDLSIDLPGLRLIRNVVERMKTFNPHLVISASTDGTFILQVENESVNVATTFKNLTVESEEIVDDTEVSVRVDIKKFILFLASEQLSPSKIVCNFVNKKLVHMFLSQEDLVFHYFLSAVSV